MKLFKKIITPFLLILPLLSFAQDEIIGVWLSESKEGKTEIYKKDGKYYGKLVWLKETKNADGSEKKDIKNPNSNFHNQPLIGLNIIKGLSYKDTKWSGGNIYDPKTGKSYDCVLFMENNQLKVRGYLGWIYETRTWTRIK